MAYNGADMVPYLHITMRGDHYRHDLYFIADPPYGGWLEMIIAHAQLLVMSSNIRRMSNSQQNEG